MWGGGDRAVVFVGGTGEEGGGMRRMDGREGGDAKDGWMDGKEMHRARLWT